ncbi:MAG: laccase domain-containing protein [Persephonella sp.]|nr:laccase domain-containing protein [Persephonella sp.]
MKNLNTRENFIKRYKLPTPVLLKQKHSPVVLSADSKNLEGDGLFTQEKNRALGVLTADCMPVVLTDFFLYSCYTRWMERTYRWYYRKRSEYV